jgi:hypothetical protein
MITVTPNGEPATTALPANADGDYTISDEQATTLSGGSLGPIQEVTISFTPDGIRIIGKIAPSTIVRNLIPGVASLSLRTIEVTGKLELVDGRPHLQLVSLKIANQGITSSKLRAAIESAINSWLINELLPGRYQSLTTSDGTLTAKP